ncbi:MAG: aldo/keto reductase [Flavobacteriaceae bacterium]
MKTLIFRDGNLMPALGLGTWKAKGKELKSAVKTAIRVGYRHIDTAAVYGNEEVIGEALAEIFEEGTIQRKDLFITTKLWNDSHHPDHVIPALTTSMKKLGLNYLDLYLIHWPVAFRHGTAMPSHIEDYVPLSEIPSEVTWAQMEEAKKLGLAKHIGVSNFSVKKLNSLMQRCGEMPEVNQIELHPLLQQNTLRDFCKEHHILLMAYSPLGSGDRHASMKAADEPNLFELPIVKTIADKHGVHPAQVLIAWHICMGVCVIPKSTTPKNIESNFKAAQLKLDAEDLAQLGQLDRNYRYVTGTFFESPEKGYSNVFDE